MASDGARSTLFQEAVHSGGVKANYEGNYPPPTEPDPSGWGMDFSGKIFDLFNESFTEVSTVVHSAFTAEITPFLMPLTILYILARGWCILRGFAERPESIGQSLALCFVVMAALASGDFLADNIFWFFTGLPLDIMSWIVGIVNPKELQPNDLGINGLFDHIFASLGLLSRFVSFEYGNITNSIFNMLAIFIACGVFAAIFLMFMMLIINNLARVHIFIALSGPIIFLALFEKTRGMFFGMMRGMTQYAFSIIYAGAILGVMAGIF